MVRPSNPTKTKADPPDYCVAAEAVVKRYGSDAGFLIPMLQDLQAEFAHVPQEAMKHLSRLLRVPLSQLYSVATFYPSFSLIPRGKHLITLCMGTVCYLKGARAIAEAIQKHLNVEPGATTEDRLFTFLPVNCLGACALAPVLVVDEEYFGKVKPEQVPEILEKYAEADSVSRHGRGAATAGKEKAVERRK